MTCGPSLQPTMTKGKVGGPTGWPADHLVGRRPSGPHRLNPATWRLAIGSQGRFTQA